MQIHRESLGAAGYRVPAIVIEPDRPNGAAVIAHGYGGNKEEQLGLAFIVAQAGLVACAIDLRGHGEHPLPLDAGIPDDVTAAAPCRKGHLPIKDKDLGTSIPRYVINYQVTLLQSRFSGK